MATRPRSGGPRASSPSAWSSRCSSSPRGSGTSGSPARPSRRAARSRWPPSRRAGHAPGRLRAREDRTDRAQRRVSAHGRRREDRSPYRTRQGGVNRAIHPDPGGTMLLILAAVLLVIAIAGGVIVHPLLFLIAILAIIVFFIDRRGRVV